MQQGHQVQTVIRDGAPNDSAEDRRDREAAWRSSAARCSFSRRSEVTAHDVSGSEKTDCGRSKKTVGSIPQSSEASEEGCEKKTVARKPSGKSRRQRGLSRGPVAKNRLRIGLARGLLLGRFQVTPGHMTTAGTPHPHFDDSTSCRAGSAPLRSDELIGVEDFAQFVCRHRGCASPLTDPINPKGSRG